MKHVLFKYIPKKYEYLCNRNQKKRNQINNNFSFTLEFKPFFDKLLQKIQLIKKLNPNKRYFFCTSPMIEFIHPSININNSNLEIVFNNLIQLLIDIEKLELRTDLIKHEDYNSYFLKKEDDIKEDSHLIILESFNSNMCVNTKSTVSYLAISESIKSEEEILLDIYCPKCTDTLLIEDDYFHKNKDFNIVISCQNLLCDYEKIINKNDLDENQSFEEKNFITLKKCNYCSSFYFATTNSRFCSKKCERQDRKKWREDSYFYSADECQPEGANPWD